MTRMTCAGNATVPNTRKNNDTTVHILQTRLPHTLHFTLFIRGLWLRVRELALNKLSQYFTDLKVADFMASMMDYSAPNIRLLDPGAGQGILLARAVKRITSQHTPDTIHITAFEIDTSLHQSLMETFKSIYESCSRQNIAFTWDLQSDFLKTDGRPRFSHVIMNPPYKKIPQDSDTYRLLSEKNIQNTNMYSAFIDLACNSLYNGGQITFISPRSFCNGRYFGNFRRRFLSSARPKRLHLYGNRSNVFPKYGILQETIIVCSQKNSHHNDITLSYSDDPDSAAIKRRCHIQEIIPSDFIHIIFDDKGAETLKIISSLPCSLADLNLQVSTGKTVDFRIKNFQRTHDTNDTVPLVRAENLTNNGIVFPIISEKKPNFIINNDQTRDLLCNESWYVLVKRFAAPEQNRRISAFVWDGRNSQVAIDNKINYFHGNITKLLAAGLCRFLNSKIVDKYFRQFSGSTMVNANDIRYLRFPTIPELKFLGGTYFRTNHSMADSVIRQWAE